MQCFEVCTTCSVIIYQTLVNNLNSEIEKLNIEKEKMSRKVREEKANGKTIEDYVSKWETDVEEI